MWTIIIVASFSLMLSILANWICYQASSQKNKVFAGIIFSVLALASACGQNHLPDRTSQDWIASQNIGVFNRNIYVSEIVGRDVVDVTGRELGTIQHIAQKISTQELYAIIQRSGDIHRPGEADRNQQVVALGDLEWSGERLVLPEDVWRGRDSAPLISNLRIERYDAAKFVILPRDFVIMGPHGPGGGGDD